DIGQDIGRTTIRPMPDLSAEPELGRFSTYFEDDNGIDDDDYGIGRAWVHSK
ncbi:MAG: hypothetical protein QOH68_2561, partial [Nocardioidaceae bacterium]|nr:hypothetical protein [Nocardioidaceae bacterium]